MRICFFSRRYFPAISGMSVYARNLLHELVALGHEVTMISQYRGDEEGTRVYGGGPPPAVPGVRVLGLEALGEQEKPVANFERDIETMVATAVAEHARAPFDLLHAQYGYPTGLAALVASRRLNLPNVVSIQGGDGHWVGVNCCETHREAMRVVLDHAGALLIGSKSFAGEVHENHGTPLSRFTVVPGAVDATRFRPRDGLADRRVAGPRAAGHPLPRARGSPQRRARPARRLRHPAPPQPSGRPPHASALLRYRSRHCRRRRARGDPQT